MQSLESQKASYKEMTKEAIANLEMVVTSKGKKTKIPLIVPVVPEHNSPISQEQLDTAEMQTARARLVAATLALDLPTREQSVFAENVEKIETNTDLNKLKETPLLGVLNQLKEEALKGNQIAESLLTRAEFATELASKIIEIKEKKIT